jgi:tetratricopeptide (TPR) repeat protein
MTRRSTIFLLALAVCCSQTVLAQRGSAPMSGKTELYVYVTFTDQTPVKQAYKVQLLTSTRMIVDKDFTNDRGQAIFRGVSPGDYRIVVTGLDIDEAEIRVTVESHGGFDSTQNEHVEVRRTSAASDTAPGGAVSVATLKIPDDARKEYDKGLAALDHNDIAGAQQHLARSVELYPQYSAAFLNLGVIAMQTGHRDEGMHYFEQANKADPKNAASLMYLAKAYLAKKNYKEAEPLLAQAVTIIPSNPEPLTLLATLELQQGEYPEAVINAQKVHALQQHQPFAIAHYVAAEALMRQSLPEQAAVEYRLFLKEAPSSPVAGAAKEALSSIPQPK